MTIKLRRNHKFLTLSNTIDRICKPLKGLHIHHFTYLRQFNDGREIYLCNDAQWIMDYYQLDLFKSSPYASAPEKYTHGFDIWMKENNAPIFQHGQHYFDDYYGMTFCDKSPTYHDFFFFAFPQKYVETWRYIINNLELLKYFIHYFYEKTNGLLKICESYCIKPFEAEKLQTLNSNYLIDKHEQLRKKFLSEIHDIAPVDPKPFLSQLQIQASLTVREKECLRLLLTNQTAKNIAQTMNISVRTVETHLENIRQKWHCNSKSELIIKAVTLIK
jgi:DNA-binding CsgD family transcriptional regulator